jgi:hypothetical protein
LPLSPFSNAIVSALSEKNKAQDRYPGAFNTSSDRLLTRCNG